MTSSTPPTQKIGRFAIVKRLGRGAQGAVFLARDPDLDRLVAIKLVNEIAELQHEPGSVSAQARNLAQLRHPNIVALYESGRFHNFTYLVFEYLEGRALREELSERGALPLPEACSLVSQVTDAMAYAHAKGIVHLDLTPNNIMRDEAGKPRVMDFDLSRNVSGNATPDLIAGTVPYMAPEQFTDGISDTRADVFSLGQILYECVTGHRVVPEMSRRKMADWIIRQAADPQPLLDADPSGGLAAVYRKATEKDPAQRFQNAREMHDALRDAWQGMQAAGEPKAAIVHGTVAFVLKRIERKGDFPAVSRTLAEVNRIASDAAQASVTRLSNVVLRDFALASRLLKLANSSYYSRGSGRIKTVSEAIGLLGVDQVRLTCNGLACFGHFAGRKEGQRLREESITAFVAGLIARHLAAQTDPKIAEEAFLAGMLFELGRMLALFYFPEDFEDIEQLVADGASEEAAARTVLGISLPEVGRAIGQAWGLPPAVLGCMIAKKDVPPTSLQAIVPFANALASVDLERTPPAHDPVRQAEALGAWAGLAPVSVHALLAAAVMKFRVFAPALEVKVAESGSVQRMEAWLGTLAAALAPQEQEPQDTAESPAA